MDKSLSIGSEFSTPLKLGVSECFSLSNRWNRTFMELDVVFVCELSTILLNYPIVSSECKFTKSVCWSMYKFQIDCAQFVEAIRASSEVL